MTQVHPTVREFLTRQGLPIEPRADGRIVLTIDQRYRIACTPAAGDLLLETRIGNLPLDAKRKDEVIDRIMQLSGSRLNEHADGPVLQDDQSTVALQRHVPRTVTLFEFERALGEFANGAAYWKSAMKGELE
ncbi:CesT family type III secretion system chaperone [Parachitinimonas caeni]|uniref:CesT family type III secretion system chaperone n=1 Tax=Parachitinimonas caeni TaxID=3031301 RepID=A0ABT7DWG8_9NEIS|nr:CesT family type III secretion system chaperone [Parachitinimonas caeni]MDK2123505.1 CesT family type III secretion system chaperone [Parachitinimonas caeni]